MQIVPGYFCEYNHAKWVIYIVKCVCAERNDSDIGHAATGLQVLNTIVCKTSHSWLMNSLLVFTFWFWSSLKAVVPGEDMQTWNNMRRLKVNHAVWTQFISHQC